MVFCHNLSAGFGGRVVIWYTVIVAGWSGDIFRNLCVAGDISDLPAWLPYLRL